MEKKLSVSVVATPEADWTIEQIADDYARCAGWAVESGADFVELNCSCPNVSTSDGQLYQNAEATGVVADRVREAMGEIPLLIKIGHITDPSLARELIVRLGRTVNALVMVNCLAAKVESRHGVLFSGQPRGIAGHAIREAALAQIRLFRGIVNKTDSTLELVGVGGISSSSDVRNHLREGASGVQVATSAMLSDRIEIAL
jgi:dihydroorotate dehydrogenase